MDGLNDASSDCRVRSTGVKRRGRGSDLRRPPNAPPRPSSRTHAKPARSPHRGLEADMAGGDVDALGGPRGSPLAARRQAGRVTGRPPRQPRPAASTRPPPPAPALRQAAGEARARAGREQGHGSRGRAQPTGSSTPRPEARSRLGRRGRRGRWTRLAPERSRSPAAAGRWPSRARPGRTAGSARGRAGPPPRPPARRQVRPAAVGRALPGPISRSRRGRLPAGPLASRTCPPRPGAPSDYEPGR
jgi:hypothetical protein